MTNQTNHLKLPILSFLSFVCLVVAKNKTNPIIFSEASVLQSCNILFFLLVFLNIILYLIIIRYFMSILKSVNIRVNLCHRYPWLINYFLCGLGDLCGNNIWLRPKAAL
jgi:presenilin-like A22 family membrane protease